MRGAARRRARARLARPRRAAGPRRRLPRWALPPAGLRHPRVPTGHLMSVQSVCLGWHWYPYVYSRTADDTDGAPVKPLPQSVVDLARAAVAAAYGRDASPTRPRSRPTPRSSTSTAGRPARAAPGRRGAVGRPGRHDQPRRHLHVPAGRRRPSHRAVHRPRAAQRRPARVRRTEPADLPRRPEGASPAPRPTASASRPVG